MKIVPLGQTTSSGRNHPSLTGARGSVIALNMVRQADWRRVRVQLTGPRTWGADPV